MPRQSTTFVLFHTFQFHSALAAAADQKKFVLSRCYQDNNDEEPTTVQHKFMGAPKSFWSKINFLYKTYDQQLRMRLTRCPLGHAPLKSSEIHQLANRDPIVRAGNSIKRIKWEKFMWWSVANGLQRIRSRAEEQEGKNRNFRTFFAPNRRRRAVKDDPTIRRWWCNLIKGVTW